MTTIEFRDRIYLPCINQGWSHYDKATGQNYDITNKLRLKAYDDNTIKRIFGQVKLTSLNTCLSYFDSLTYLIHRNKLD